MSLDYVSNQEIIQAARRNLPQDVWDYLTGGAESETTMRRNRLGFDCLALRPRVLVDVSKIDTSTTFLGQKLRIPVMMAPIGSLQSITPEGGVAVAKAAAEFGTMNFVSSVTQPSLEEIAASTNHPKIFQLYVRGGLDWCAEIIGRELGVAGELAGERAFVEDHAHDDADAALLRHVEQLRRRLLIK